MRAFEYDRDFVIEEFRRGEFDHLEILGQVSEAEFFKFLLEQGDIQKLSATYPRVRKRTHVPLWLYVCSQLALRLHGSPGYAAYPYVIHCGGLRQALGPEQSWMREERATGRTVVHCEGYNDRNDYERTTPCDQDFLRKVARSTEAEKLLSWYGSQVARYYGQLLPYDRDGLFIVDGSYLFVPDNEHYERSSVLFLDERNHPLSRKDADALPAEKKKHCRFQRCYRSVLLLSTTPTLDHFLFAGARLLPGRDAEVPQLGPLVDDFVNAVGKGVMKKLLFDRGFIDGKTIGRLKRDYGIDSVFPLKKGMLDYEDAKVLASIDEGAWEVVVPEKAAPPEIPPGRPESIRKQEQKRQRTIAAKKARQKDASPESIVLQRTELKAIRAMKLWDNCSVPIHVVVMRDYFSDGSVEMWELATTGDLGKPSELRSLYRVRTAIEERHRQTKCFWDLTSFRSGNFNLVTAQLVYVLMAYSLLQIFLVKSERGELTSATRQRMRDRLLPMDSRVVIYRKDRVASLTGLEHQELVLTLKEGARRRILGKTRRLRRLAMTQPELPERPD